jgi:hypothetical protein
LTEIPPAFRGSWDELIDDGCLDREPRFHLEPRTISNFEVEYDVLKVTLRTPSDLVVHVRLNPVFGQSAKETWQFKLVQDGRALAAPDGKPPFYRKCSIS